MFTYDIIVTIIVLYSFSKIKTPKISLLLFFNSILTIGFIVYKEFILDQNSDYLMSSSYKRFLKYFVPVYYSETLAEFAKASYDILLSKEFLRTTLSIVSLVFLSLICILSLVKLEVNQNRDIITLKEIQTIKTNAKKKTN